MSLSISIDYCRKYQPEGDSEELYYSVTVDQLDLNKKNDDYFIHLMRVLPKNHKSVSKVS